MKKFLSAAFAFAIALSLSIVSAAASVRPESADIVLNKIYTLKGGTAFPAEKLSFTVVPDLGNQSDGCSGELVIGTENSFEVSGDTEIPLSFPTYSKVGVYKYTVHEIKGDTLGVIYDETPVIVVVSVSNAQSDEGSADELEATVTFHKEAEDGEKVAEIRNEYGLGSLTVSKKAEGNLASVTKAFDILVTFTGGAKAGNPIDYTLDGEEKTLSFNGNDSVSTTVSLRSGDSVEFTNIPAGVSYTVAEDAKHTQGDLNSEEGYSAAYANSDNTDTGSGFGLISSGDTDSVEITNTKGIAVETGVLLDSLPYILIAVGVIAAAVIFLIIRKRRKDDD